MSEQIDVPKANKTLIIAGSMIAVLIVGLLTNGFGLFKNGPTGGVIGTGFIPIEIKNSPVLGNANAPVTIYVFSDFSCPFCSAAAGLNPSLEAQLKSRDANWEAPIPAIIDKYVNTGKAKLVFKYTAGHGSGKSAHLVALALNEQNLFWKFHDLAFQNQADTNDIAKMKALARQAGADMNKLENDLKNNFKTYESMLAEDNDMGKANGVTGTPAFIINGRLLEGAQSFSSFKEVIEKEI